MAAVPFGLTLRRARRQRGLSLRALQTLVRYDFTYLGQVERGEKPGSLDLAASCDEALAAGGRILAAFREPVASETDFPQPGIVAGHVSPPDSVRKAQVGPPLSGAIPERVDGEWRTDLDALRRLYHGTYCVDQLARRVRDCLNENARRLRHGPVGPERRSLLRRQADAALLAGRLALFDTWAPVVARGYLTMAYEAASEAGDDALAAAASGHLAFVPAREHLTTACRDYLRIARRHAERSDVPTLVSWVAAVEAEVLVTAEPRSGLQALDRAVDALAAAAGAPVPGWFDYFSAARLQGFRGQVLAAAGRGDAARDALRRGLADLEPEAVKQRAVLLADLAGSHLCDREPDVEQIAALMLRAACQLGHTQYLAAADRLGALRERLEPWRTVRAVRDLDEALAAGDVA